MSAVHVRPLLLHLLLLLAPPAPGSWQPGGLLYIGAGRGLLLSPSDSGVFTQATSNTRLKMKAVVSLLLLCLLQVTLAQEQQEVEAAAREGGSLQPAGLSGLLVRENREAKKRNRNGKGGGKKKTGTEQKKGKKAKKVEGRKKGQKKFKNVRKGKGRNKATKKPKNNRKRKNRKKTTEKKRNHQNEPKKRKQERMQNIKDGSIAKKKIGRKGKKANKPKNKKNARKNRKKNLKRNQKKKYRNDGIVNGRQMAESFTCPFWRFSRNASIALTQSQRAKRTRRIIKRLEKRSKTTFMPIFEALSKATTNGKRCAGAPINNNVKGNFLILKNTCNSTNIMAKCKSALITLLTPQTNKTINDCESKLKSFNSKYKLSIFKNSGGVVSGVCPALLAITPTIATLTADNCFDQDTFKNVSAQAVTVFDGCKNVIQQCNRASDTAALDLLPCLAGETTTTPGTTTVGQQSVPLTTPTTTTTTPGTTTGSMMTTPRGRNLRRDLVEKLFNKLH